MTNLQAVPLSESKAFAPGIVKPTSSFKWFAWLLALVLLGDFLFAVYRPLFGHHIDLSTYLPAFAAVLLYAATPSVWPGVGQLLGHRRMLDFDVRLAVNSATDALSLWRVTLLCISCAYCIGLLGQRWGALGFDRTFLAMLQIVSELFTLISSLSVYWLYLLFRSPNRSMHAMGTPLWSIATVIVALGFVRMGVAVGLWDPATVTWAYLGSNVLDCVLTMLIVASLNVSYLAPKWWMAPILYLFALSMFMPSLGFVMPDSPALPVLRWIYAGFQVIGLLVIQIILYHSASRGALVNWFFQRVRFCKEIDVLSGEDGDLELSTADRERRVELH